MKRRMFGILAALSLLLFAAVVWTWVRSFDEDVALLTWKWSEDRYAVRSHWGRVLFVGPPGVSVAEDAELESLGARMSNQDLAWTSLGRGYVQGEAHEGTATWEMYRLVERESDDSNFAAVTRVCLRGLEDPRRFAACHVILLLEAEDRWRARWVDEAKQPWREASAAGGRLILFIAADETGAEPDASRMEELRHRWDAVLYEARATIFHGWIALGALVLPIAWLARPRREPKTVGRWVFNGAALASVLLLAAAVAAWVRSYRTTEQWTFAARFVERPAEIQVPVRAQSWVGSMNGRLKFMTHEAPEMRGRSRSAGYRLGFVDTEIRLLIPGVVAKDELRWSIPGIEYAAMPMQELRGPGLTPGTATYGGFNGYRQLVVSWWVPVVLASFLPSVWVWRHMRWRRGVRDAAEKLCVKCGYDVRASEGRCPECGEAIVGEAGA